MVNGRLGRFFRRRRTALVIDPSESKIFRLWFRNLEISKQGRVEIKTFLILLLHRLLIRMEEGSNYFSIV